ncbi:MAG: hypothetical protein K2Q18_15020, partial [Bdellovibrionales bacterium]|nr:hypothetical protein [Bdellovibrionales bacterium]
MKITVISYSLSNQPKTLGEWKKTLLNEIQSLVESGSDVLLYPELFLMGLSDYFKEDFIDQLKSIANFTEKELLPDIEKILHRSDVMLVLGSGPRFVSDNCFNTSFVWANSNWYFQDKLHLTPWEVDFTPGESIQLLNFKSLKVATIICYDVEQPGLALKLKEAGIHLLLVPSATTNRNGNQRVNRCASGRSIELGAAVAVVPLIGDSLCDLVDHNEGRQGFFMPAQELVQGNQ